MRRSDELPSLWGSFFDHDVAYDFPSAPLYLPKCPWAESEYPSSYTIVSARTLGVNMGFDASVDGTQQSTSCSIQPIQE